MKGNISGSDGGGLVFKYMIEKQQMKVNVVSTISVYWELLEMFEFMYFWF